MACSQKDLALSNQLYSQVQSETNISKQIVLLEESNRLCYAPELEMSIWMLKAEETTVSSKKIAYYKEAIGTLNDFSDRNESQAYLDTFHCALAKLYKPIDKEVAYYYAKQVEDGCSQKKSNGVFKYIFLFLIILIFSFKR